MILFLTLFSVHGLLLFLFHIQFFLNHPILIHFLFIEFINHIIINTFLLVLLFLYLLLINNIQLHLTNRRFLVSVFRPASLNFFWKFPISYTNFITSLSILCFDFWTTRIFLIYFPICSFPTSNLDRWLSISTDHFIFKIIFSIRTVYQSNWDRTLRSKKQKYVYFSIRWRSCRWIRWIGWYAGWTHLCFPSRRISEYIHSRWLECDIRYVKWSILFTT